MRDKFLQSCEWKKLRQQALERDNHCCVLCGSDERLNVHHILYRRFFNEHKSNLDNLITVCQRCHFKIHKSIGNFIVYEYLKNNFPLRYATLMRIVKS